MPSPILALLPRAAPHCTTSTCPASASILGYAPSRSASIAFTALFALSALLHLLQGLRYKAPAFAFAMALGSALEAAGTAGRIMLASSPFAIPPFQLQICLLTLAPAFYAAGVYLQLAHLVRAFGPAVSRIPPPWYTRLFVACDALSIVLQGAGGAVAATAPNGDARMLAAGTAVMMAGLTFQVFTLLVFGAIVGEYFVRLRKHPGDGNVATAELRASRRFRGFLCALGVAYAAVLIRCIYRVAEMAGGWGNEIMKVESAFLVLDPAMCAVATFALNVFHPGMCFEKKRRDAGGEKVLSSDSDENVRV